MIFVDRKIKVDYLLKGQVDDVPFTTKLLNQRAYTVKDTGLSHRQINSLAESKMFPEVRDDKNKWRKFSFKDLVYFQLISECRKFGIENKKLKELRDAFYKIEKEKGRDFTDADEALSYVFGSIDIHMLIHHKGFCYFYGNSSRSLWERIQNSMIYINFNRVVLKVLERALSSENNILPEYKDRSRLINDLSKTTEKEREILDMLRNKDYKTIKVKKGDGSKYTVYGESMKGVNDMTEVDLLETLKDKTFANIQITKRDGRIVGYTAEDVFKV